MKQFIEALKNSKITELEPHKSEALEKFREYRKHFEGLVGKRALYISKSDREQRVVRIVEAQGKYVRLEYNYYGLTYSGTQNVCCQYSSLMCGDDRLDVE